MNLLIIAGVVGPWQIVLIVAVALLMFGGKKIPELMGGIGKGMKEFKKAIKEEDETPNESSKETPRADNKREPLKE
ncbi:MAG TPA: twin-arginine translocase TatA/TatE family subunit [Prolixibacteraceae bacterium]|nr:twin-arginine translocase TatA/TatE family subunit [Prolixibacteraceae bacterium]